MKLKHNLIKWFYKHPQVNPFWIFAPGFLRLISSPLRVLPDFLIIGAGKCGTTSLYNYLIQHPNIHPAKKKELNYFFRRWTTWYRPNFPTIFSKFYATKIQKEPFLTGESSPFYLLHPSVPKLVKNKIPKIKLIALLRNPIDRAFAQYHHQFRQNYETRSFEEAINLEKIKTTEEWEKLDESDLENFNHSRYSYLEGGQYYKQLKIWMDIFPKEQFIIINAEEFFSEASKILSKIFDFLEVPDYEIDLSKKHNMGFQWDLYHSPTHSKNNHQALRAGIQLEKMNPDTKKFLKNYFRPHNEDLIKLLEKDFQWN